MNTSPPPPGSTALGAERWARIALVYLALAIYGSLVPLRVRPIPLREAVDRFLSLPWLDPWGGSRSDWVANVLLFLPLGFFLMAALCADRPRGRGPAVAPLIVAAAAALSASIEFVQIFLPDRGSAPHDVVAETVGASLGVALWIGGGAAITAWVRGLAASWRPSGRLLPAYLAFLALVHLMPLDLTISPVEVLRKIRSGGVVLAPTLGDRGVRAFVGEQAWNVAYFAPLGLLLARSTGRGAAGLAWGVGAAFLMESIQVFTFSRTPDVTDALAGSVGAAAGWAAGRATSLRGAAWPGRRARGVMLAAWVAVLATLDWWPFDFDTNGARSEARLLGLARVPFAGYYWSSEFHAFDQILHKTSLFVPVGVLLAPAGAAAASRAAAWASLSAASLIAVGLEAGQLLLPDRYAGLDDILLGCGGAYAGLLLARTLGAADGGPGAPARRYPNTTGRPRE